MKKIIPVVLILALIVGGAGAYMWYSKKPAAKTVADYIKPGPIGYYQYTHSDEPMPAKQQQMMDAFKNYDWHKFIANIIPDDDPELKQSIMDYAQKLETIADDPIWQKLFGQQWAIGIYTFPEDTISKIADVEAEAMMPLFDLLSVVTKVDPEIISAEWILRSLGTFDKEVKITDEVYLEHTIHLIDFRVGDFPLKASYTFFDDILVFGFGTVAVKNAIDIVQQQQPSIVTDHNYQQMMATSLKDPDLLMFMDGEKVGQLIKSAIAIGLVVESEDEQKVREQMQPVEEAIDANIKDFKVFFASRSDEMTFGHSLMTTMFNFDKMSRAEKSIYTCADEQDPFWPMLPQEMLTYQWTNCFNIPVWIDYLEEQMAKSPEAQEVSAEEILAQVNQALGMDVKQELFPALGNQLGLMVDDVSFNGPFPLPQMILYMEVLDQQLIQDILNGLLANPFLQFETKDHQGISLQVLNLPFGTELTPAYTFWQNHFVLTTNVSVLMDMIDGQEQGFSQSDLVKQDFIVEHKQANYVNYVNTPKFVEAMSAFIKWGKQWAEMQMASKTMMLEEVQAQQQERAKEIQSSEAMIQELQAKHEDLKAKGSNAEAIDNLADQISAQQENHDILLADYDNYEVALNEEKLAMNQSTSGLEFIDDQFFELIDIIKLIPPSLQYTDYSDDGKSNVEMIMK